MSSNALNAKADEESAPPTREPRKRRLVGRKKVAGAGSVLRRRPAAASADDASGRAAPARRSIHQVPDEVLNNKALNAALAVLPSNYNFEVHKSVWRLQQAKGKM